jgi:hypothetical protein
MFGLGIGGSPGGTGVTSGQFTTPFQPTMAQLAATPGYQFTLGQGLQATQNSFASQGLGASGAAARGAANYAENLASTTYQQQFQNYWTQNQAIENMLTTGVGIGQSAANQTGAFGTQATALSNNLLTSGAAAEAGGLVGASNSLGGNALLYSLLQGGMYGGGGAASIPMSASANENALSFQPS